MGRLSHMNKREKLSYLADLEDGYRPFDKHALTLLRSLLDDHDAEVRAEAIACLWYDPDSRWIDVLMRKATDDPHADVRAHAISALGRYIYEGEEANLEGWDAPFVETTPEDYQRVTDFLFRIAQDPEESLSARRYALEALAFRSDDPDVTDLIEWAYHHRDRRLKISAIFAMARHGDPRWAEYILAELRSRDSQVQYEAVRAAGELGLTEATDTLSNSPPTRPSASRSASSRSMRSVKRATTARTRSWKNSRARVTATCAMWRATRLKNGSWSRTWTTWRTKRWTKWTPKTRQRSSRPTRFPMCGTPIREHSQRTKTDR